MKKYLFILAALFISITACNSKNNLKEGDVVFQISKSSQSKLVAAATGSPRTHCGIIVYKGKDPYVLEASSVVKLTKYSDWKARGVGEIIWKKRFTEKDIKIKYQKYLGQKYDLAFKFDNGKMYCSELVYLIYKEQFNIELAKPKPVSKYHILLFKSEMKKRHININQLAVSPEDIYESKIRF